MIRKIISLLLIIGIIAVGYWQKDVFLEWIHAGGAFSVAVSIAFVSILAFFPIVPFVVAAGIIGAVFGTWTGSLITLTGSLLGAVIMFVLSRYGFRQWAQATLVKYPKAKEYESFFEKHAFASILFVRLVPVIPSPAVNILAGVSKVSWLVFFVASAIGKFPSNLVFNLAGNILKDNKLQSFLLYGVYFGVISVLAYLYIRKQELNKREVSE